MCARRARLLLILTHVFRKTGLIRKESSVLFALLTTGSRAIYHSFPHSLSWRALRPTIMKRSAVVTNAPKKEAKVVAAPAPRGGVGSSSEGAAAARADGVPGGSHTRGGVLLSELEAPSPGLAFADGVHLPERGRLLTATQRPRTQGANCVLYWMSRDQVPSSSHAKAKQKQNNLDMLVILPSPLSPLSPFPSLSPKARRG